jgi:prolyl-tRNA synthetase
MMKDSYSFDLNDAGLDESYNKHDAAYRRIFTRCGLDFVAVEADSGAMGGSKSQEFMVYTDAGEDLIVSCADCDYASNLEKATSRLAPVVDLEPTGDGLPQLVYTPGKASIADVAEFFQILPAQDIKCVAYMAVRNLAGGKKVEVPVIAFLRGDHMVNETKLTSVTGTLELRPMQAEELEKFMHGPAGYLGPIGLSPAKDISGDGVIVVADRALQGRHNLVCGANKADYHYRNVTPGRDFDWTLLADIRNVLEGEACPVCGDDRPLKVAKAVEVGHIFKLGGRYTDVLGVRVLDPNGKEVTPTMGCYGIGMERILTAAIELFHDANGFFLPRAIAPFDVIVTITNTTDPKLSEAAETLAASLESHGFDVLLDDRDERAGVKFKDADLIGVPYRINVGKKVAEGRAELVTRATLSSEDIQLGALVERLQELTA